MPKIVWVRSRYKNSPPHDGFFQKLWNWYTSLDKFLRFTILIMLLTIVATPAVITQHLTFFQHAATNKTATISVLPTSGSYALGQQFTINMVIDGGGQVFNAAQAKVSVSSNLTVQSLTLNTASNGCNFTFVNTKNTPTTSDPSFAGAILNGSSTSCILYTLVVQPTAAGIGTITISNGSVKAYANSSEILLSATSGSYTLGTINTPTPTPITPTATPTQVPINTPTPTPLPLSPTPTSQPINPPTFDVQPTDTYKSAVTLTGTMDTGFTVYVNNSTTGVTYSSPTSWQYSTTLIQGTNTFTSYTQNGFGQKSSPSTISINLHKLSDINGDGVIDLTDLSMFATDWGNTGSSLNYSLSDMNNDGIIDLTDFSILAKAYGN